MKNDNDSSTTTDNDAHTGGKSVNGFLLKSLNAATVSISEPLQGLWGGQGSIVRVSSDSPEHPSAVLKMITHDRNATHPRGWNSDASFQRKQQSYAVECCWYERYSHLCHEGCVVPQALGIQVSDSQRLILLEDLRPQYPARRAALDVDEVTVCLVWLAQFHAQFMGHEAPDLWEQGTYWHLSTRQDEFAAMEDGAIKQAATALDKRLRDAHFQTLVHGDAKVANFCFSDDLKRVAAVDFQYVGQGCGIRDVVYLLGSCLPESECQAFEQSLLAVYFGALRAALTKYRTLEDCEAIEQEWRGLYEIAWTDFYRFLLGWMPAHPKINGYTKTLAARALRAL